MWCNLDSTAACGAAGCGFKSRHARRLKCPRALGYWPQSPPGKGICMDYRVIFDCPENERTIKKLIGAASSAGAGKFGNYSRCAIVTTGYGTWKSGKGSHPSIGKVGRISKVRSVKIDMSCPSSKLEAVCNAIRKAHPYEEPNIYFIKVRQC